MGCKVLVLALALIAVVPASARADDKPWAAGVTEKDQSAALALFRTGNTFFELSQYKEALDNYVAALKLWDHPAIRYNAAVCLINLDRAVEAYENVIAALRFGEAPIGKDLHAQGETYKKLLERQTAVLEVTCKEPKAIVTVDGQRLQECPGTQVRRLLPGEHQIVASKDRFQTESKPVILRAGQKTTLVLELRPIATGGTLRRRWSPWKPWAVVVGGSAIALAGLPLLYLSREGFKDFDSEVLRVCPAGCADADPVLGPANDLKSRAALKQSVAIGAFVTGGALVATGALLIYLNQPRLESTPMIAPVVGPDRVGVVISGRY